MAKINIIIIVTIITSVTIILQVIMTMKEHLDKHFNVN